QRLEVRLLRGKKQMDGASLGDELCLLQMPPDSLQHGLAAHDMRIVCTARFQQVRYPATTSDRGSLRVVQCPRGMENQQIGSAQRRIEPDGDSERAWTNVRNPHPFDPPADRGRASLVEGDGHACAGTRQEIAGQTYGGCHSAVTGCS